MGSPTSLEGASTSALSRREQVRSTSTTTDSLVLGSERSEVTDSGEGSRRRPGTQRPNSDPLVPKSDGSDATSSGEGRPRRQTPQRRPYSDYSYLHRKIEIHTIAEDGQQQIRHPDSPVSPTQTRPVRPPGSRGSTSTSAVSPPSTTRSQKQETSSDGDGKVASVHSIGRPSPGHTWSRSKSGSVWYERLRNSPNRSKDSVSGSSGEIATAAIVPLRPPRSKTESVAPSSSHQVKIEKSFTNLQRKESPPKQAEVIPAVPTSSRRSSVSPKRIFSAPFQVVRRLSFFKRKEKTGKQDSISPQKKNDEGLRQLADHKTLLRRNRTAEALRRVNSILLQTKLTSDAISPVSILTPARVMSLSEQSLSSKGSRTPRHRIAKRGKSPQPKLVESDPSSTGVQSTSYTSSQLALRLGAQPNNTPDERATYKVKRSPSAESEEFFKVDISIRGGTSYLPSEARRIHTPPLPQDGPDGRKRGFFFDYNAPRSSQSRSHEPVDPSSVPIRSTSRATTVGKKAYLSAGKVITRNKANDWYDVKLAQLEDSDHERAVTGPVDVPPVISESARERSESQTSISEIRKRKEEVQLDYSIPEHLPTSPLCPRHPRYWRIVKGKGSQYRGCWMHGVGLWEEGSRWANL